MEISTPMKHIFSEIVLDTIINLKVNYVEDLGSISEWNDIQKSIFFLDSNLNLQHVLESLDIYYNPSKHNLTQLICKTEYYVLTDYLLTKNKSMEELHYTERLELQGMINDSIYNIITFVEAFS